MEETENTDVYRAQSARVLARKEAEMERLRQNIEATQSSIKKMYRQLLNDEEIKSSVSQEMIQGVKGQTPVSQVLEKLMSRQKTADGINADGIERFNNPDNAPTGMEDRYWERE